MEIEDFFKIIVERRSCREFKKDPVPDKDIQQIVEAARWAPSSANSQPWDVIVVKNPETKTQIQESVKRVIAKIKELRDFPFLRTFTARYMLEAPVQLVVCSDPRFKYVSMMHGVDEDVEQFAMWGSVSMAIQNMLLTAQALGLGSVVFTNFYPSEVKEILSVPDPLKIICILPIGYAAGTKNPPHRRKREDFLHWEQFDIGKKRSDELIEEAHRDPYGVQVKNY
jgi:5,6-dimethylbenzimidazole synthase